MSTPGRSQAGKGFEHIGLITREHAIKAAQNAVRNQGYAVAVHGSQVRDLDLVAIPWQETALTARQVAGIIAAAIPGLIQGKPEEKPHGRLGFVIYPRVLWGFDNWYIDLSVMPRRRARQPTPSEKRQKATKRSSRGRNER